MKFYKYITLALIALFASNALAQEDEDVWGGSTEHDSLYYNGLVQFSGVVVSSDSLQPVPFANIFDKSTRRGTVSDYYGYFSFVAGFGDTIVFDDLAVDEDGQVLFEPWRTRARPRSETPDHPPNTTPASSQGSQVLTQEEIDDLLSFGDTDDREV